MRNKVNLTIYTDYVQLCKYFMNMQIITHEYANSTSWICKLLTYITSETVPEKCSNLSQKMYPATILLQSLEFEPLWMKGSIKTLKAHSRKKTTSKVC